MSQPEPAGAGLPRLPVAASFAAFILIGARRGAKGVLIPSLQTQYGIDKGTLSLVFLAGTVGYLSAAFSSGPLVAALGLRRLLLLAGGTFALGAGIMSLTPPFLALVGFSLGPICPTTIALLSTPVPARLLPSGIGFVAGAASMGAALLFWVAGALVDHFGLPAVLPYVLGLTVLLMAGWLALSATPRPAAAGNKAPQVGV